MTPPPRTPLPRPTLIPGLSRVWRGPVELQLGLDPAHAVRVEMPDPRLARVLDLLDGNRPERQVLLHAAELGVSPDETRQLLDLLHHAGLVLPSAALLPATLPAAERRRLTAEAAALALDARDGRSAAPGAHDGQPGAAVPSPARTLRRRRAARVLLAGRGRLGATIAVALAEAGVGHVHPDLSGRVGPGDLAGSALHPADLGDPLHAAVAAAIRRAAPGTQVHEIRRAPVSVVVQLAHDQPAALVAAAHAARRRPHLAVRIRDGAAVVGPFVPATGGPCLNCLELHRRERDPEWPGAPAPPGPDAAEPCAVATVLAATGYATAEVLAFLDGGTPQTLGAAVEITAPGRFRRRTWPAHPGCTCHRRSRRSADR
ncbi:ThiF family adenylyltransferase [Actinoplanes teichomyceticus]|uniref:ThiF family protein n=1 Tax=Actinoplanes teichomyceticus TaxID=1867 RepID=A0A561WPC4_ACTTI|nr:ThiF family adenylyltransferase [Actinoplanes teichomyceticus]TWG25683.1 ThiF family protein [Actinoplanes teichomyceticus]